ncbi:MAG: LysM peptidoglycan-binding domain-containing protein [Proteobacteria bacterium]|nr:LysM peptidoglycan-binding domain-containing protein [Pseudomonadota bacterium]
MNLKTIWLLRKTPAMIALSLLLAPASHAKVFHTLQRGENLAIVAKQYYGDPAKALLLIEYNGISDPRTISPGRRIVIPEVRLHRVRKGDTLALIAKRYLKDARKSQGLARLNRIKDPKSLSPGTKILIPVEILHTAKKGESLSSIAKKYYGHFDASELIALYNNVRDPVNLKAGTRLILPISDLKIISRQSQSRARPQPKSRTAKKDGQEFLEKGTSDYFMGDYTGAVKNLQRAITLGLGTREDMSKAQRFLAYSYVALDQPDNAKDSFRQALRVDPDLQLDPVYVSPKIIEIFEEVRNGGN